MRKIMIALAMVLALVFSTGCEIESTGGDNRSDRANHRNAGAKCLPVSKPWQKSILGDLEPVGKAYGVKSKDYKDVYMIASKFRVGDAVETGVWATPAPKFGQGEGLTFAVDGFAHEFTDWPHEAPGWDFYPSVVDHGVSQAKKCVR